MKGGWRVIVILTSSENGVHVMCCHRLGLGELEGRYFELQVEAISLPIPIPSYVAVIQGLACAERYSLLTHKQAWPPATSLFWRATNADACPYISSVVFGGMHGE